MTLEGDAHRAQIAAVGQIHSLLRHQGIDYWLFGGWAVDFHAGRVSRSHGDIDVAIWISDRDRVDRLLRGAGWRHTPQPGEDGYTQYVRDGAQLDLAFLARDPSGSIYTPASDEPGLWPDGTFGDDMAELQGVRACVISVAALRSDKAEWRSDPITRAKDQADVAVLDHLRDA
jgi:hypothetical protein